MNTLQRSVLNTFRKFLTSSPAYLEVLRDEGIWDLLFSENFFYFGPAFDDSSGDCCSVNEEFSVRLDILSSSNCIDPMKIGSAELLQLDVISFVELAATSNGSAHNLVSSHWFLLGTFLFHGIYPFSLLIILQPNELDREANVIKP